MREPRRDEQFGAKGTVNCLTERFARRGLLL